VPTPDTAALAARLIAMRDAPVECGLGGPPCCPCDNGRCALKDAADALAALSGNPTPQTTGASSTDNAPSVSAKLTATPSGNTMFRLGSVTTAPDVAAFVRGAEWAAQRYTATGEQDFYAIAERAARGEHVPPSAPAPSVAEAREGVHDAVFATNDVNDLPAVLDRALDRYAAAIRAVPKEVREIATRVARETDGERDDVTVAVLDEMGRVNPIARVRDLRALARHGLGET